ncbi:MAG TPA: hypothetical protein ACFYEM_04690, partial [Candidatus Hypogeohydataceae bacterium YC40]
MKLYQVLKASLSKSKKHRVAIILEQFVIFLLVIGLTCETAFCYKLKPGGLTAYSFVSPELGPNLLVNSSFEQIGQTVGAPSEWSWNGGFFLDSTVGYRGSSSYCIKDAHLGPGWPTAWQTVSLKKGAYRISGWIKLENVAVTSKKGSGVRIALRPAYGILAGAPTNVISGTSDWQYVEKGNIVITQDTKADFRIEIYGNPDGTAWFDDLELREELPLPLNVFLLYPNYRGMLFDDQSQTIRCSVEVNLSEGANFSDYNVQAIIMDEADNSIAIHKAFPRLTNKFVAELDGTPLINEHSYLVRVYLVRNFDKAIIYEYSAYRISKLSGSARSSMTMSFDENNRFLLRGKPTFILGVYDADMPYTNSESTWETQQFGAWRRLFELPINLYLNFMYGKASITSMDAMMNVLLKHGVLFLQTANCFAQKLNTTLLKVLTDDYYLAALSAHPGLAGFYIADENRK